MFLARAGRSAGGNIAGLLGRKKDEREKGDERILGSGNFVTDALQKAGEIFENKTRNRPKLEKVIGIVTKNTGISVKELMSSSRKTRVADARALIAHTAVMNLGYKGSEVAEVLSLSRPAISQLVDRGKILIDKADTLDIVRQIN